MNVVY